MSGKLPVNTVLAFLEQINAGNVEGLCALMTVDHLFVAGYFRMLPDYRVSHTDVFCSAEGTLAVKGELPKENHWSVPSAWRAVVRDGLMAEWQVYADNQSARKIMGVQNP
jgi:hypothetical protein